MPAVQQKTKSKSQPLILIGILIIIIAAGAIGGYQLIKGKSLTMTNPLKQAEQALTKQIASGITEEMFKDISDPLIRKHFVKQYSQTGYRTTTTSSGRGSDMVTVSDIYMQGDKTAMRTIEKEGKKEVSDTIIMNDTYFVKDYSDGVYWKQTLKADDSEIPGQLKDEIAQKMPDAKKIAEEYVSNVTYTSLGQEACGSLTCHKYQEVSSDSPDAKRIMWFDTKDLLLRKEMYAYGEFDSTVLYEYGITVTAPTKTKDVPKGKSVFEMSAGSASGGMNAKPAMKEEDVNKLLEQYMPQESEEAFEGM